jgi:hypothetical protein
MGREVDGGRHGVVAAAAMGSRMLGRCNTLIFTRKESSRKLFI